MRGQDSAEQIRHRELSRALAKINLSPEEKKVIERLSHSLVDKLLRGPISGARAHAEIRKRSVTRDPDIGAAADAKRR